MQSQDTKTNNFNFEQEISIEIKNLLGIPHRRQLFILIEDCDKILKLLAMYPNLQIQYLAKTYWEAAKTYVSQENYKFAIYNYRKLLTLESSQRIEFSKEVIQERIKKSNDLLNESKDKSKKLVEEKDSVERDNSPLNAPKSTRSSLINDIKRNRINTSEQDVKAKETPQFNPSASISKPQGQKKTKLHRESNRHNFSSTSLTSNHTVSPLINGIGSTLQRFSLRVDQPKIEYEATLSTNPKAPIEKFFLQNGQNPNDITIRVTIEPHTKQTKSFMNDLLQSSKQDNDKSITK